MSPTLAIISASWTFCKNHPGILLVLIGVIGEIVCGWERPENWRQKLERLSGILLIIGLVLEIWEAVAQDKEVAQLSLKAGQAAERASLVESNNWILRSNVAMLEWQTKSNFARIDPRKQPITSVEARAWFTVAGGGAPRRFVGEDSSIFGIAWLAWGRSSELASNLSRIYLVADTADMGGGDDSREFMLNFHMPTRDPLSNASGALVESIDELDAIRLEAWRLGLKNKIRVLAGEILITVNGSFQKRFLIPAQSQDGPEITTRSNDRGFSAF